MSLKLAFIFLLSLAIGVVFSLNIYYFFIDIIDEMMGLGHGLFFGMSVPVMISVVGVFPVTLMTYKLISNEQKSIVS